MKRLFEVRTFVSRERDIESAMKCGSPVHATLSDGRSVRIHIVSLELSPHGLYSFRGTIASRDVEGFYGNASEQRPQKLMAGIGMVKFQQ